MACSRWCSHVGHSRPAPTPTGCAVQQVNHPSCHWRFTGGAKSRTRANESLIAFDLKADTASLFGGDCTSCRVTQDKSSYWAPAMYFKDADTGEFEIVEQVGGMLA